MRVVENIRWIGALTWALAAAVLVSGFASRVGMLSALLGGFAGSVLGDVTARTHTRWVGGGLLALAWTAPWCISWLPLDAVPGLVALETADVGCKTLFVIWIIRVGSLRITWVRPVVALGAALAFAQALSAHRYGNLSRPYALMDGWIEKGYDPTLFLWLSGAIITVLISGLFLPEQRGNRRRSSALIILAMVLITVFLTRWAPPLPFIAQTPPPPPRAQSPEPPPPPPPRPNPIALVQFDDIYRSSERLGGYYFRTHTDSHLQHLQLTADGADLSAPTSAAAAISQVATSGLIRTRIFMLDATNHVPILLNGVAIQMAAPPGPPFRRSYSAQSAAPGSRSAPDLDLSTFRQRLTDPRWTPDELANFTREPTDTNLVLLAHSLVADIPEMLADYLPPRVKVIRHWLNHNFAFSAKTGQETADAPITNFLFNTRTGGGRQFAEAAVLLFRCVGIPARLGIGYVVPLAPNESRSEFVVSDAHAQEWPEVYLDGTGWVPVPLNPTNVLDRPQPVPDPELEAMLQKRADETVPPKSTAWTSGVWRSWVITGLGVWVLVVVHYRLYTRYVMIALSKPDHRHKRALQSALSLAASAGLAHQPGETYPEWCQRIHDREPARNMRVAILLRDIVTRYRTSYETGRIESARDWFDLLIRTDVALWRCAPLSRLLPFLRRRPLDPRSKAQSQARRVP